MGRKAPGLPHPEHGWAEITFMGAQKCSVGITLEQGHPTRQLLHPQSVFSRCKPIFCSAVCWQWGNVGINLLSSLWSPQHSPLGSSFVWSGRRDCSNLIFHLYCSVHSLNSYLQAYSNRGLNMGIFISVQASFLWTSLPQSESFTPTLTQFHNTPVRQTLMFPILRCTGRYRNIKDKSNH